MPIDDNNAEKLAEAQVADEERRKRTLPPPQNRQEREAMRQVRDTDMEGDN